MQSALTLIAVSPWISPLWRVIAFAAALLVGLWVVFAALRLVAPAVAAIAWVTTKQALLQPLFYVLLLIGVFLMALFVVLPYNTLGEDIKMVKDEGFVVVMFLALAHGLWMASVSIADEIEDKTALTLLSKPVGRLQFVFGKFLGVIGPVALIFIILGAVFLTSISFKVVYDARELSLPTPGAADCWKEIVATSPGLLLAFMEAIVLTAISVAISTRLPLMPNLMICGTVYLLGNLAPQLLGSSAGKFEIVAFAARFFTNVLPVLDNFNIQAAVAAGVDVPAIYLFWTGVLCVLYTAIAMLLALLLFEDRDLA